MQVTTNVEIAQPKEKVWAVITDIKNCSQVISAINGLEVLHQPDEGLVGLKWKETRLMFGKQASETMWITEAVENEFYCTRAESHGSVYLTRLSLAQIGGNTVLTMSFSAEARSFLAKFASVIMGFFIKGAMKKALDQDLNDIKAYVERK